jgi:hypothetical protein
MKTYKILLLSFLPIILLILFLTIISYIIYLNNYETIQNIKLLIKDISSINFQLIFNTIMNSSQQLKKLELLLTRPSVISSSSRPSTDTQLQPTISKQLY